VLELVEQIDQLRPDEFKWFLKCAVPEYQPQQGQFTGGVPPLKEARVGTEDKDKRNGRRPGREARIRGAFPPRPRAWTCPGKKFPGSLSMRILAITNIYPSPAFPARVSLCRNRLRVCALSA